MQFYLRNFIFNFSYFFRQGYFSLEIAFISNYKFCNYGSNYYDNIENILFYKFRQDFNTCQLFNVQDWNRSKLSRISQTQEVTCRASLFNVKHIYAVQLEHGSDTVSQKVLQFHLKIK